MDNDSLITKILKSVFFKNAKGKAGRYAGNATRLMELAQQVMGKLNTVGFKGNMAEFQSNVQLLIRMVKAYASGEYKGLPWKSLVSIVAVLIYFISPIDIIPDFLPLIGITDDIALVIWLIKTLGSDVNKFSEWEKQEKTINIG
ncbi:YkvA family protein [Dyadobacter sp. NIV53]|uniref:YkvA family protein n=1 Tax=Dyadobacter sp. NIV53 TaxID=2861765 RepID=UPI001C86C21B|nr:YkvA family protein [Dyadobacter sp. NIV53]